MRPGDDVGAEGIWGCVPKNGIPYFFIYDQIAGRTFQCVVPDTLLSHALASCHRRVEIVGTILETGHIRVTQIHPFPQLHQIPSVAEMRLLLES